MTINIEKALAQIKERLTTDPRAGVLTLAHELNTSPQVVITLLDNLRSKYTLKGFWIDTPTPNAKGEKNIAQCIACGSVNVSRGVKYDLCHVCGHKMEGTLE